LIEPDGIRLPRWLQIEALGPVFSILKAFLPFPLFGVTGNCLDDTV